MRRIVKRSLLSFAAIGAVAAIGAFTLLSCARVETTAHGAPTRLRIPVGVGDIAFPIPVAADPRVSIPGFLDGPVVRRLPGNGWSATWFCEDHVGTASGNGDAVRIECAGNTHAFPLREAAIPPAVAAMPSRLVVLSDLEGNAAFLEAALRKLAIVDAAGNWRYGDGQLLVLGDSVDRGRDVFAVLWRLHALAADAEAAGGAVRVLLGNHEQYMLRTNPSKANPEHLLAMNRMGGYREAFSGDTVIGAWLRRQPVLVKLGPVLFAHAGISPQVASSGLAIAQLNAAMADYWDMPPADVPHTAALDAVLAPTGVTQYRGYFREMEGSYPLESDAEVEQGLAHFGASQVVVAHTIVEHVHSVRGGRVWAVDVNHDEAAPEVLVYENGVPRVVDIGVKRNIHARAGAGSRGFSLFDPADRALLLAMCGDFRRLSALPYPY
jgi:hypothetical protein